MKWKLELPKSRIYVTAVKEGESIEQKMRRVTTSKEPIDNVAPLLFTDRKDGVLPEYDHRTDRFELAMEAMDRGYSTRVAVREAQLKAAVEKVKEGKVEGEA